MLFLDSFPDARKGIGNRRIPTRHLGRVWRSRRWGGRLDRQQPNVMFPLLFDVILEGGFLLDRSIFVLHKDCEAFFLFPLCQDCLWADVKLKLSQNSENVSKLA